MLMLNISLLLLPLEEYELPSLIFSSASFWGIYKYPRKSYTS